MTKAHHKITKIEPPELHLPRIRAFYDSSAKQQVMMWRRAKDWLRPEKRSEANKTGKPKPNFGKTEVFLELIETHWETLRSDAKNNPDYFDWPETKVWLGDGSLSTDGWLKDGVLSVFGYNVGQDENLSELDRQKLLDQIFELNIPPIFGFDQLAQWGEPDTAVRLHKMANCLASFTRNAKHRKGGGFITPIKRWEADLQYLKSEFYDGKFRFGFPDTAI